jgi:hypothetical protein
MLPRKRKIGSLLLLRMHVRFQYIRVFVCSYLYTGQRTDRYSRLQRNHEGESLFWVSLFLFPSWRTFIHTVVFSTPTTPEHTSRSHRPVREFTTSSSYNERGLTNVSNFTALALPFRCKSFPLRHIRHGMQLRAQTANEPLFQHSVASEQDVFNMVLALHAPFALAQ